LGLRQKKERPGKKFFGEDHFKAKELPFSRFSFDSIISILSQRPQRSACELLE
jgi:hypothetical protein